MSTLRTFNLQNPDSGTVNIEMDQGGNTLMTGIATVRGAAHFTSTSGSDAVGIGTDITAYKLDVRVTGAEAGLRVYNPDTSSNASGIIRLGNDDNQNSAFLKLNGANNSSTVGGAANLVLGTGTAREVHLATNGTSRFKITSSGVKQVLNGNLNIYQTYIDFSGDQSSTPQTAVALYRPADGTFAISTQNTERLRITSTGKVLVSGQATLNSTSLTHPIQIAADSDAQNIVCFGRASDDISAIDFYEADKSTNLGEIQYRRDHVNFRHRVGDIRFATGGTTERVRINQNGCLQVGSPSGTPSHLMELRTASGDPEVIAYAPTGQKTIFNCTGSNRFALERGYSSVFEIQDPNGNGVRSDLRFDGNIILNKSMGDTNNSAVQLYRLIGPQNLSLGSGMTILGSQTDTMSTKAARITTSNSNGTAWFGPYGTIHPGSYTAMFHMKVSNNSNTSTIIRIDVHGVGITDAGGYGDHRPRSLNLAPSHFDNADRYQYIGLDFNFVNPVASNVIEVRGINFNNSRGADLYLDHILIVPRIPSHDG